MGIPVICGYRSELFYRGLSECLVSNGTVLYEFLGLASYSLDLKYMIKRVQPSIVITSTLYDGWPLTWLLEMRDKLYPQMKIVVLTFNMDEKLMEEAKDLGVDGYLYKSDSCEEIHECLRLVISGKKYIKAFIPTNPGKKDQLH